MTASGSKSFITSLHRIKEESSEHGHIILTEESREVVVDLQGRERSGGEEDREAGVEAGAVTDNRESGHSLAERDGMEPHERRAWPGPRSRWPAQPLRP